MAVTFKKISLDSNYTGTDAILATTGTAGSPTNVNVAANTVVGRQASSITNISIGTNRVLGRLSSNIIEVDAAGIMTILATLAAPAGPSLLSTYTTLGDLKIATGNGVVTRVPLGATVGHVLTLNSLSVSPYIGWAAATGGGISVGTVTTIGDLIVCNAATPTVTRLPKGTDYQILRSRTAGTSPPAVNLEWADIVDRSATAANLLAVPAVITNAFLGKLAQASDDASLWICTSL